MVATYGQIAAVVGRCSPLMVGFAMAAVPFDSDVPWHRVVNHQGRISSRGDGDGEQIQRILLEAEGIHFDEIRPYRFKPGSVGVSCLLINWLLTIAGIGSNFRVDVRRSCCSRERC